MPCTMNSSGPAASFYLFRDSDSAWLPIVPGSTSVVENANCILAGTGLSSTVSGQTASLTFPITFKAGFSGDRVIYASATDSAGAAAGWLNVGSWSDSVQAAPSAVSVSPSAGTGVAQTFAFNLADPNGGFDISTVTIVINSTYYGANGCSLRYSRAANTVSLFRDSHRAWLPVVPRNATRVSLPAL